MTRDDVQEWLERYVEAWRSYDPDAISELFAQDATYAYHPYDGEPLRGRDAIVANWRSEQDEPGSWQARYDVSLVDGDRATAVGETRYASGHTFSNLFQLAFDDAGRCTSFIEWYMEHPRSID